MMNSNDRRPRPYITQCDQADLDWDPIALEQFTFPNPEQGNSGEPMRAGDSFAIVRPGMERWPLGHTSDVYRPSSHRHTINTLLESAGDQIEPYRRPLMAGHGTRVIHAFQVRKEGVSTVAGLPVRSRLVVVHDHTGLNALKARMCVYVGDDALGSIVGARAIHVAENPERWRLEVEGMVERSRMAQDALVALLAAAERFALGEADKAQLTALGVKPAGKEWGSTLLQSMVLYHRGNAKRITYGVWARRLTDDAVVAMVKLLGPKKYGVALDLALGGRRYGGKATDDARKTAAA